MTASSLLGAFMIGVFYADSLPLPLPPLYGGPWHPWMATLALAGVLVGAVFFPSSWARALSWSTAIAFLVFEMTFAVSRMPAITDVSLSLAFRPWTRSLEFAIGVGIIVLLCSAAQLLDRRREKRPA